MAQQLGGPVLLKQGYMQIKTSFGWKRQYYRLLQVGTSLHPHDPPLVMIHLLQPRVCLAAVAVTPSFSRVLEYAHEHANSTRKLNTLTRWPAQDSLFSFNSHESKTPTDEVSLMGGNIKDASWDVKNANCVQIETDVGKKCECQARV